MTNRRKIQLLKPHLPQSGKLLPYLEAIDNNHWYTNFGPLYQSLLKKLSAFFPSNHLCITSSGTSALELALRALKLEQGARVLVPTLTFPASVTAIINAGYTPVLSDICTSCWQLTPYIAEQAMKKHKIDAIMPVATFGVPVEPRQWDRFYELYSIPVIIDAAGAFGNQLMTEHHIQVFSLHATKTFSTGEGGLIVSRSQKRINSLRMATNFGFEPPGVVGGTLPGSNSKLSEYHCAVGLASLESWQQEKFNRQKLLESYLEILQPIDALQTQPNIRNQSVSMFNVKFSEAIDLTRLVEQFSSSNIETRRWYYPLVHHHPYFSDLQIAGSLTNSIELSKNLLGLPFHLGLSSDDIQEVTQLLLHELT